MKWSFSYNSFESTMKWSFSYNSFEKVSLSNTVHLKHGPFLWSGEVAQLVEHYSGDLRVASLTHHWQSLYCALEQDTLSSA